MGAKIDNIEDYRLCRCNRHLRVDLDTYAVQCVLCLRIPEQCACPVLDYFKFYGVTPPTTARR